MRLGSLLPLATAISFAGTASAAPIELAPDEIRLNVGTSSLVESQEVLEILRNHFDARLVRQLHRIHTTTVVIDEDDLATIRRHPRLRALSDFVERDGRVYLPEDLTAKGFAFRSDQPEANATPNDPSWGNQWGPPCLDLTDAWGRWGFASTTKKIAIIDTGTDLDHPDLDAHIDTVNDYDFVNGDNNADDDNGHGTHTAGIACAETNNGVGVAGVLNGGILPIKVLNSWGSGWWSDVAAGINHAVDSGAAVISMSIGGGYDSSVERACDDAYAAGVLLFGSSGNHGGSSFNYPAAMTSVIGVGSLRSCTAISSWSGRGFGDDQSQGNVEIVAAGENVLSTWRGGGYSYLSGTSMSCPMAAGIGLGYAGLTGLSTTQIRAHIQNNADNIGSQSTFGYGRIDAFPAAD